MVDRDRSARRGRRAPDLASALILAAIVGLLAGCTGGAGAGTAAAGGASPTAQASPTALVFPALTETFTSTVNGYSIGYPAGQHISAATAPAPMGVHTWDGNAAYMDNFLDSFGTGFLTATSAAIPAGTTANRWVADELAAHLLTGSAFPDCAKAMTTEPIVVAGAAGVIDTHCASIDLGAIVTSSGRAYLIDLRADPPDRTWFLKVLATVHLTPGNAVPASPSAKP